ncbi:MAG: hypothetical protein AAFQ80_09110 [Cyanobacteria bacterium J06621_8]
MNQPLKFWYIVQQPDQTCQIIGFEQEQTETPGQKQWGFFQSEQEAIARKIVLIRSGKCQPE